jgi:hypothetical protein
VEPRGSPCRADPGGDQIQAVRQNRARLTLGAASVGGAALIGVLSARSADRLTGLLGGVGAVAVLLLAVSLALRSSALIAPALVVLGGELAGLFLLHGETVDVRAPVYGAGLFVVAELAFASVELRAGTPEPGLILRRAALLAVLALGGILAGTAVLAGAAVPLEGGVALEALGVAAAVGALLLLGRLAARSG